MHFCRRIQYDPITCDVSWITWVYFLAVSHFRMHSRSSFSFIRHKHLHFRIYKEWTISLTWWIYCRGRASTRVGSAARAPSCRFLQAFILYDYVWLCMTMYDYVWLCMLLPAITVQTRTHTHHLHDVYVHDEKHSGMNDQGSLWQLTRPFPSGWHLSCAPTVGCEAHQHTRWRSQGGWVLDGRRL